MGYRLHVHKKHVIEYGERRFNWNNSEINEILWTLCDSYHGNDPDAFSADDEIEILKTDFEAMLERFANKPEDVISELKDKGCKLPKDYALVEIMSNFRDLYNDADPDDDYVHLSWF